LVQKYTSNVQAFSGEGCLRRRAYWRNRPEGLRWSQTTGCCELGSDIHTPQSREYRYQLIDYQLLSKGFRVLLWPRLLVAGILGRMRFDRRRVHVRLVVDEVSLWQFMEYVCFLF
jgi:hypothetical protein